MEPSQQAVEELRELARQGEVSLGVELCAMAGRVRRIVPDLIGISLGVVDDFLVLTLASSTDVIAAVDATQYLDGGPCVTATEDRDIVETHISDLLGGDRWQVYAQASATVGIAVSLSLPITDGDRAIGGVNLYAATEDAFVGRHEELAAAVGVEARAAITDADLSFQALRSAMGAPDRVAARGDINIALGVISASQRINIPIARQRLRAAAARAGITEAQAARAIRPVRAA